MTFPTDASNKRDVRTALSDGLSMRADERETNITHVVAKIEEKLECIYLKRSTLTIGDDSKESKTLSPELRSMNEAGASRLLHNRLQSDPRLSNC